MTEAALGRIQLLTDDVVNQIAAGEVVERPASVVKELVENALDAGARSVLVEIEDGGRKAIVISDDGCGMDEQDALLAVKRHATSKIRSLDDLYAANSMGFRGEALASIASVSKLTLTTRDRESTVATRIEMDGGGEPRIQRGIAASHGTTLACRELFFNVPARQKFLKSTASELGAISEFFDAAILCWPGVRLRLVHNGREVIASSPVAAASLDQADALRDSGSNGSDAVCGFGETALRARAAAVFGQEVADQLIYVNEGGTHAAVEGLISPPGLEKGNAKSMHTFVNRRWIKDKVIRYAIQRGYHSHLLKGRYPVVALHIAVDPSLIDVNVHPAKTEVRFQYSQEVQSVIVRAIMAALRRAEWSVPAPTGAPLLKTDDAKSPWTSTPVASRQFSQTLRSGGVQSGFSSARASIAAMASGIREVETLDDHVADLSVSQTATTQISELENSVPQNSVAQIPWHDLTFMGAIGKCYLMFSGGDRLLVVDQHAWHERIIFERLSRDPALMCQSQSLMIPELVELTAEHIEALLRGQQQLRACGFSVEFVSDTAVEVSAVPVILAHRDPADMFGVLAETGFDERATEVLAQDLLATIACHSAVRAGEELGPDELARLLRESSEVDFQHNCPHGRRVFRWFEASQIARWFDR